MSAKNPYNINTQENKFNAWSMGNECSTSMEDSNPFSEDLEPELFRTFEQGYKANKNRVPKASNSNAVTFLDPDPILPIPQPSNASGLDLNLISTDLLFKEVAKRLAEGEALLNRVKKLLG